MIKPNLRTSSFTLHGGKTNRYEYNTNADVRCGEHFIKIAIIITKRAFLPVSDRRQQHSPLSFRRK